MSDLCRSMASSCKTFCLSFIAARSLSLFCPPRFVDSSCLSFCFVHLLTFVFHVLHHLLIHLLYLQVDLPAIKAKFQERHGRSLREAIEKETKEDNREALLKILDKKWSLRCGHVGDNHTCRSVLSLFEKSPEGCEKTSGLGLGILFWERNTVKTFGSSPCPQVTVHPQTPCMTPTSYDLSLATWRRNFWLGLLWTSYKNTHPTCSC